MVYLARPYMEKPPYYYAFSYLLFQKLKEAKAFILDGEVMFRFRCRSSCITNLKEG